MNTDEGWTPCPPDTPCGNCKHPMTGHFRGASNKACGECPCQHWLCKHGGIRTTEAKY